MRAEYEKTLLAVSKRLGDLGYRIVEDTSHLAVFDNGSCWQICVEGERYSDSTSLFLRHVSGDSANPDEYVVWLLMEVFENVFKTPHVIPRLDAQIDFLHKSLSEGFPEPSTFRAEYDRLNQPT